MRRFLLVTVLACASCYAFQSSYSIDTAAGSGFIGDLGPASGAILRQAEGISTDPNGNIYVADAIAHRVRLITPAGIIRTVAGTGA